MVQRTPLVPPSQQPEESYQTRADKEKALHESQIALFQKRMGLLPEFKLSVEKADLSRRPLTLPEKTPSEASPETDPPEETMEVGGSDAEPNMVPREGDGSVRPNTGGAEMPPPTEPGKKKQKKSKSKDKELRKRKEQEVE